MTTPDRKTPMTTEELTRDLHRKAYPEQGPDWIDEQVKQARQRISRAKQADPSTAPGARRVSDTVVNKAAPRRSKGPRIVLTVALAVVAMVAAVLGITERQWVAEAAISTIGISGLLIAAGVTGLATIFTYVRSRHRRILSCRVRIDAPFGVDIGETVRLEGERAAIADPGVVVVRIKNTGGTEITADDYVSPLVLRFPDRKVISVDATDFEPTELQNVMTKLPNFAIDADQVKLPLIGLEKGHSFKLVIVLSGTEAGRKHKVVVEGGGLRDGRVTTRQGRERIQPDTLFWGGLTAIFAGAFAVVLLLNNVTPFTKLPDGVVCGSGPLTVEGSSAFGRAATELAGSYGAYCPSATIKVRTPGSREGLERLVDAADDRATHLALADGRFDDPAFAQLKPHPLAIVPFTFVVSDNVPIATLSLTDARRIFTGTARIWRDITGNPQDTGEIRVVGRSSTSGTRRTLEQYVLGAPGAVVGQAVTTSDTCRDRRPGFTDRQPIVCELGSTGDLIDRVATLDDSIGYADAFDVEQATGVKKVSLDRRDANFADIRAGYPFWTVEYLYSYGEPEPGSLPDAFRNYMLTAEGRGRMAGFGYYACVGDTRDLCARR